MDLRQLGHFVAIVDEGSISGAARRLHMSQPPLSAVVAALEKEVGAPLLERHPRGVVATTPGRELALRARRLVADMATTTTAVRALATGAAGVLSVASVPSASWQITPLLLRRYLGRWPGIHVDVHEAAGPLAALRAVRERTVDAAVIYTSDPRALADQHAPDLRVTLVRRERLVLLAPADATIGHPVRVRELAHHTWVTTGTHASYPGINQVLQNLWRTAGVTPTLRIVPTLGVARIFVQAGAGISLMNESATEGSPGNVAVVNLEDALPDLHCVVVAFPDGSPTLGHLTTMLTEDRGGSGELDSDGCSAAGPLNRAREHPASRTRPVGDPYLTRGDLEVRFWDDRLTGIHGLADTLGKCE